MRISTIWYTLKQGFKNIGRNWMFSLASIVTMAACIFLFGIFYSIVNNVDYITQHIEQDVPIVIFFGDKEGTETVSSTEEENDEEDEEEKAPLDQAKIDEIGRLLRKRTEVKRIEYISAEEAWEEFVEQNFKDHPEAAETFKEDNPLATSASYRVYVKEIEKQEELIDYIESLDYVRSVEHSEAAVNTLSSLNRLVSMVSLALIALLLIVSVFLISNTVATGISIRKEEIGIMKLIGATDFFVRVPFLLEGIILGVIGAAIPLVALYFGYTQAVSFVLDKFRILSDIMQFMPVNQIFRSLLPYGLGLGIGIGFIGSYLTTRKHLRV